jgi:hypothetical protein
MNRVKNLLTCCALCGVLAGWIQPAFGQVDAVLPYPGDSTSAVFGMYDDATGFSREAILMDGIPIAFKYDDAWSYSFPLLTQLQAAGFIPASYGSYDFAVGVGGQDAVLFTQAGGTDNDPVGVGDCCILEEPGPTTAGNTRFVESWWGQDDQDNDGIPDTGDGPNTVGEVLEFLHSYNPDQDIPVFVVDWNQTGGDDSLLVSANVFILDDADGTTVVADWSLDTITNGSFDRNAQALNLGQICFAPDSSTCGTGDVYIGPTLSGNTYSVSHNVGSGKPDFAVFAPDMDLSLYDPNDIFVFRLVLGCESGTGVDGDLLGCGTNGGEEGFMTGRISTSQVVPEPSTIALLGLGLVGFGFRRWKKAS